MYQMAAVIPYENKLSSVVVVLFFPNEKQQCIWWDPGPSSIFAVNLELQVRERNELMRRKLRILK